MVMVTEPIVWTDDDLVEVSAGPLDGSGFTPGQALSFRDLMNLEQELAREEESLGAARNALVQEQQNPVLIGPACTASS